MTNETDVRNMRERINRLAKGIIDMETPQLLIQPERIEEEVQAGELTRKEVFLTSMNGLHSKGLVYSSNCRVSVLKNSFGGLRNHISYEINSRYLEYGDVIEGSFYLVTNGGEKEIPYSFRVQAGASGKTLGQLKEPKDFGAMAKQDYEMALRIFEYRDFTEVPFMQDMHVRAIYDGLKGHGNRYCQLEQFLVALGLKEPVRLKVEDLHREYFGLDQVTDGEIEIHCLGWGYIPIQVEIKGNFIQTVKKTLDERDFKEGVCRFPYRLSPAGLHGGKNFGTIALVTTGQTVVVEIEASTAYSEKYGCDMGTGQNSNGVGKTMYSHQVGRFARYLTLRLDYESGCCDRMKLQSQMLEEVEQIRMSSGPSLELTLMEAELKLQTGRLEDVKVLLESCRNQVISTRMEHPEYYCLYQYMALQVAPDREKMASLSRLLRKYMEEGRTEYLLFYLYTKCEEQYCFENPGEMLTQMKVMYGEGCHSPFLYQQALAIWNDAPELLYGTGAFELQVLNFGARRRLVKETLAVKMSRLAMTCRNHQPLWLRVLKQLYEQYPQREILEAVCSLMIRGECRQEKDFPWYEQALKEQLSLTRLYEYYLYSLPTDYKQAIPKEVLLYFSYDTDLDRKSRAVLYANIIGYVNSDSAIYREYQKEMGRFAVEQVLQSRIDSSLAVIYDAMIYEDMVDASIAQVLPSILKSYKITVNNPKMRQVVVRYEELMEEGVYPIQDGVAYVPVFSDRSCIMFQDSYGNRYMDVSHIKVPVLDRPELEKKCFEVYPEHSMLLIGECRKLAAKETLEEENLAVLEQAVKKLKLHPLYKSILTGQVIGYYRKMAEDEMSGTGAAEAGMSGAEPDGTGMSAVKQTGLASIDESVLSGRQRTEYCEVLISYGYDREAYGVLCEYLCDISLRHLQKLCSHMILDQLFGQDELLQKLAFHVYEQDMADSVILDYLCEHFNGTSGQMLGLLMKGTREHVETYDLEERLLAQMLFTGQTEQIDRVFARYIKKNTGELLVRAYFTVKSGEYFLHDVPADEMVFQYLEAMVCGTEHREKLSTMYLLALSKYYASLGTLTQEQKELCQNIVDILLGQGMVFPHFKQLADQVRIPEDVLNKAMIQYIGRKDSRVDLQIRIRPQEEVFHSDEMERMYQGIFVRQKVLFDGETLEYRIYEQQGDERVLKMEGSVACDRKDGQKESRFKLLNEMSMCLRLKEEAGLKKAMEEYVQKTAVVEELFGLLQ